MSHNLIQELESRHGAMKVSELTELLGVDDKHIYRMAARGQLPSFRVGGAVRFDPQEVANWLRESEQEDPVLCPGNLWNQSSAFSRGRKFRTGSSSYFLVLLAAPLKAFALPKTYL